MSFQSLIIAGHLGRDPEMRYTPSGQAVTSFSVATSRKYTNQAGQVVEQVAWFRVSAWGKQAESCNQYLKKGSQVLVEGRLQSDEKGNPRTFQRQDGTTGTSFEVTATSVNFLSSSANNANNANTGANTNAAPEMAEEEMPF